MAGAASVADKVHRAKVEELLGERGAKLGHAVRFRDLGSVKVGVDEKQVADIAGRVADEVAREVAGSFDGANVDLSALQARIDAAEAEALAASAAAQNAQATANAAGAYTDQEVADAKADMAVDFAAAQTAAGQAQGHAAAAATSALTATSGVARLFPMDFRSSAIFWLPVHAGNQDVAAPFGAGYQLLNSPVVGDFLRIDAGAASNMVVMSRGVADYVAGRTIRVTVKLRSVAAASGRLRLRITTLNAEWAMVRITLGNAQAFTTSAADTWQEITQEILLPAALAGEVRFRAGVVSLPGQTPDVAIDLASIRIEDVTLNVAASGAAASAGIARDDAVIARGFAETAAASAQSMMEMAAEVTSAAGTGVLRDQFLASESWANANNQGTLTITANERYPIGRTWDFTVTNAQNRGMVLAAPDATVWPGQANALGYVVEIEYTLISGSLGGARVYLDWNTAGPEFRAQKTIAEMTSGTVAPDSRTRTARGVFLRPADFAGTFTSHDVYFYANAGGGREAKQIQVHRIFLRVATEEEMGSGQVMAAVQSHLTQNFFTRAETNSAIAAYDLSLNASFAGLDAEVTQSATSLSNTQGAIANFKFLAQVGGASAAGIEAVSIAQDGQAATSALVLHGDNVVAPGTMSANAMAIGLGKNLLIDPDFGDGIAHWYGAGNVPVAERQVATRAPGITFSHPAWPTLHLYQSSGYLDGTRFVQAYAWPVKDAAGGRAVGVPVTAGKRYMASAHYYTLRCNAQLFIYWYDAAGAVISTVSTTAATYAQGSHDSPDGWARVSVAGVAPVGAAYAAISFVKRDTFQGEANSYLFAWKPQLEETHATAAQPSAWSPGGTTYINGGRLFARSVTAREASFESLAALGLVAGTADIADAAITNAKIGDAAVTNAKIGGLIQSDNFVAGVGGAGWRILKSGAAEFNTIKIRRQIQVASGTVNVGAFTPAAIYGAVTGANVSLTNGPGHVVAVMTTPVAITEWLGAEKTYLCNVGMTGSVISEDSTNCYWGWTGDVLPLSKWSGNQSLRLRLKFWSQRVDQVNSCTLTWKIYEVS